MSSSYINRKYIAIIVFLLILYLAFLVIRPILFPIVWAFIFTYLFYPFYKYTNKLIKNEKISAFVVTFAIIVITIISFTFVFNVLSKEIVATYHSVKEEIVLLSMPEGCQNGPLCTMMGYFKNQPLNLNFYADQGIKLLSDKLINQTSTFAFSLPVKILELFIMFFAMFYLFMDGKKLLNKIREMIPMPNKDKELLINRISEVINGVVYGYLVTAIIISVLAAVGFSLFGIKYPVLFGILCGLSSFLPAVSTMAIWLPLGGFELFKGFYFSDNSMITKGIGLLIFGVVFLSGSDNLIKAKIIGDKARVHPAIILFGAFGGLFAFGLLGAFVGPLILTLAFILAEEYSGVKRKEVIEDLKP